jgi:hypothetical protein
MESPQRGPLARRVHARSNRIEKREYKAARTSASITLPIVTSKHQPLNFAYPSIFKERFSSQPQEFFRRTNHVELITFPEQGPEGGLPRSSHDNLMANLVPVPGKTSPVKRSRRRNWRQSHELRIGRAAIRPAARPVEDARILSRKCLLIWHSRFILSAADGAVTCPGPLLSRAISEAKSVAIRVGDSLRQIP